MHCRQQRCARSEGAPDHLVAAALLHDVGHLVSDDNVTLDDDLTDDFHHERVGAQYLARWFGPEVTAPVALHVAAKRYLCAVEPGYLDGLSPSSTRSLALQGGPMSADEVTRFEQLRPSRRRGMRSTLGRPGQGRRPRRRRLRRPPAAPRHADLSPRRKPRLRCGSGDPPHPKPHTNVVGGRGSGSSGQVRWRPQWGQGRAPRSLYRARAIAS